MIERATTDRLRELMPLIEEFYASSKFLNRFNPDHCEKMWINLITNNIGIIFLLIEHEKITGFLAALKYPDINSGELVGTEMAWFVKESQRGRGLLLLKEFEKWAKEEGCKKITMGFLIDLMPEKVQRVYENMGYKASETHYIKEIENVI